MFSKVAGINEIFSSKFLAFIMSGGTRNSRENSAQSSAKGINATACPSEARRTWLLMLVASCFVAISCGLVAVSKYLMQENRFPYPAAKIAIDMFAGCIYVSTTRLLFPSVFTSWDLLSDDTMRTILRIAPIGVFSALEYTLSTAAYIFVSVELIQILKGFDVVAVYLISLAFRWVAWNWRMAVVIFLIAVVLCLAVAFDGNLGGVWYGIIIQLASQAFAISKLMLLSFFLGNGLASKQLDQFTLILIVAPVACIGCLTYQAFRWDEELLPRLGSISVWPMIILSTTLSFAALVVVNTFLRLSNAVSFLLTGILKNIFIVFASTILFHDQISPIEITCFLIAMFLIMLYGFMKIYRSEFEQGYTTGFRAMFTNFQLYVLPEPAAKKSVSDTNEMESPLCTQDSCISYNSLDSSFVEAPARNKLIGFRALKDAFST